jgi:hypothetical protein
MRQCATGSRGSVEDGGGGCRRGGGRLPCRRAHGHGAAVGELQAEGLSIGISLHFRRGWGSKCGHDGREVKRAALGKQRKMNCGANGWKRCDAMARAALCLESAEPRFGAWNRRAQQEHVAAGGGEGGGDQDARAEGEWRRRWQAGGDF